MTFKESQKSTEEEEEEALRGISPRTRRLNFYYNDCCDQWAQVAAIEVYRGPLLLAVVDVAGDA